MESLMEICSRHISGYIAGNLIGSRSLQDLPVLLLEDIVPLLTQENLGKLQRFLTKKGVNSQLLRLQWLKFFRRTFRREVKTLHECSCYCTNLLNEDWRQMFLDKSCQRQLHNLELGESNQASNQSDYSQKVLDILLDPSTSHCNTETRPEPLEDYSPASLHLPSRLLPFIQKDDRILQLLQRSLKELVISHYLPKYNAALRHTLEHLIHNGVLRMFTLKHPKSMTPDQLYSILEVCAGRFCSNKGAENTDTQEKRNCCKRTISHHDANSDTVTVLNGFYDELSLDENLGLGNHDQVKKQDLYDFSLLEPIGTSPDRFCSSKIVKPPNCESSCESSEHCIQHLVLCGFLLDQPDYSEMLRSVLGLWPGLQELELVDNLLQSLSCAKILTSVAQGQSHVHSLRRLRLEDNSAQDCVFQLTDLLSRCKLDTLELEAADLSFSSQDRDQSSVDAMQLDLSICECFAKLNTIELTRNNLVSLTCLERALAESDCVIKCLDLGSCQLETKTLDDLFIRAKDCMSLRDLNVSFNTYTPSRHEMELSGVRNQPKICGLVQLLQTGQLAKLDMSGCSFSLTGWSQAEVFVRALRNNSLLRQFLLMYNDLTNSCLALLADAFIFTSEEAVLPPRLCLDIRYNLQVTDNGLHAFSRALCEASSTPRCRLSPPRHLTITANEVNSGNFAQLAKFVNLTVSQRTPVTEGGRGRIINLEDLMVEHLSQM